MVAAELHRALISKIIFLLKTIQLYLCLLQDWLLLKYSVVVLILSQYHRGVSRAYRKFEAKKRK